MPLVPPALPEPQPLPEGADALAHYLSGQIRRLLPRARRLRQDAAACHELQQRMAALADVELDVELQRWREACRRDPATLRGGLLQALACIGEAAGRSLGMRPYPVQLMGALGLHRRYLMEMATGEGKTLTSALAAVLAGWSGRPCHLITANDYLAARDAEDMAPLYARCQVTSVSVTEATEQSERPACYAHDVVYITAKELLADVLRDRMAGGVRALRRQRFQQWLGAWQEDANPAAAPLLIRGLHTAIVDEADSVLIDEAVTPLILSTPGDLRGLDRAAEQVSVLAEGLQEGADYQVLPHEKVIVLRGPAQTALEALAERLPSLWRAQPRREELLRQALLVRHFFRRDQHYVVQDDKVVLLDESTGRLTPQRSLSGGLHQAIEACEQVPISAPTETLTQMSFQGFFRSFHELAGTTGTALESRNELWQIYGLEIVQAPTHRPSQRRWIRPRIALAAEDKWASVVAEIQRVHAGGRPVLAGTRSVEASEQLAERLDQAGLPYDLLNAVRHEQEAEIVARAGTTGRITIATNMAGRGTDIRLAESAQAQGGLYVIATEHHESARVDRQLAGRCARQGQPGTVASFASLEDELVRRFLPAWLVRLLRVALQSSGRAGSLMARAAIRLAQWNAGRQAFHGRMGVLRSDRWLESALPFSKEAQTAARPASGGTQGS